MGLGLGLGFGLGGLGLGLGLGSELGLGLGLGNHRAHLAAERAGHAASEVGCGAHLVRVRVEVEW